LPSPRSSCFFAISSLVLGLGRWTGDRWLPAKAFTLLAVAATGGYVASLDALTSYAEKKKEKTHRGTL